MNGLSIVPGSMFFERDAVSATVTNPAKPGDAPKRISLALSGEALTVSDLRNRLTEAYHATT